MPETNTEITNLKIDKIGINGDGIGKIGKKTVIAPYTISGEEILLTEFEENKKYISATEFEISKPSEHRINPPCKIFGQCGGCNLQHLDDNYYIDYKKEILSKALEYGGFDNSPIDIDFFNIGSKSRRKVKFSVKAGKKTVKLGLFKEKSHELIDIHNCLILEDKINDLISPIKDFILKLSRPARTHEISIFLADNGIELSIGSDSTPDKNDIKQIEKLCDSLKIIKTDWQTNGDTRTVLCSQQPHINIGKWKIESSYTMFSQSTRVGQEEITRLVLEYLKPSEYILDLYSGCGTYSLPLASDLKQVASYEGSGAMVESFRNSIEKNFLQDYLEVKRRDLLKNPLKPNEISIYDGVVINPPRNGAGPQIKNIAESKISNVVIVSCSPSSLGKDIQALKENGYKLVKSTIIDQFLWSNHIESVSLFTLE